MSARDASEPRTLRGWLAEGPFSLALSSGFFGFFAHAGVVDALVSAGFVPAGLSGSSAGALVSASFAAGLDPAALVRELEALERAHFWDPGPFYGLFQGGYLRGDLFRRKLEAMLPVATFEACPTPVAVSVFDVRARATRVIARGDLASAVVASCAVPGLFRPVAREGRLLLDGGIRDRPGIAGLSNPRALYHHLASRSPWRTRAEMRLPRRTGLVSLVLEGLPRCGPDALDRGIVAMRAARERTLRALDQPIVESAVHG